MIRIDRTTCDICGTCVGVCPADAIVIESDMVRIVHEQCISCLSCVQICPAGAASGE
ncbi:MAG TPA: 4Fe-4S binding protein [Armatimonadota bacterium]|nr:4Fe-4S binding protein [Armatimonadota bacterium]